MKVAFWNGTGKVGNVTGYLAAISAYCAIGLRKTVYVSSNHLKSRRWKDYFFNNPSKRVKENFLDCYLYGEPEYFRKLWEDNRQGQEEVVTLEGIHLLQPPDMQNDVMFHRDVGEEALYFMDIPRRLNASSAKVLEEADLVVVFLPQEKMEIHIFFDMYSSIIPKALFFIAEYRKDKDCTPEFLQETYGIEKERTGMIPYNVTFESLCELGAVGDFFRNSAMYREKSEVDFKMHLKRMARMILKYCETEKKSKEGYELSE